MTFGLQTSLIESSLQERWMGESESFLTKLQPGTAEIGLFPIKRQKEVIAHVIGEIILFPAPPAEELALLSHAGALSNAHVLPTWMHSFADLIAADRLRLSCSMLYHECCCSDLNKSAPSPRAPGKVICSSCCCFVKCWYGVLRWEAQKCSFCIQPLKQENKGRAVWSFLHFWVKSITAFCYQCKVCVQNVVLGTTEQIVPNPNNNSSHFQACSHPVQRPIHKVLFCLCRLWLTAHQWGTLHLLQHQQCVQVKHWCHAEEAGQQALLAQHPCHQPGHQLPTALFRWACSAAAATLALLSHKEHILLVPQTQVGPQVQILSCGLRASLLWSHSSSVIPEQLVLMDPVESLTE